MWRLSTAYNGMSYLMCILKPYWICLQISYVVWHMLHVACWNTERNIDCLTGSGYIACYIIKALLLKGYTVRGTVRNVKDSGKTAHIRELVRRVDVLNRENRQESSSPGYSWSHSMSHDSTHWTRDKECQGWEWCLGCRITGPTGTCERWSRTRGKLWRSCGRMRICMPRGIPSQTKGTQGSWYTQCNPSCPSA